MVPEVLTPWRSAKRCPVSVVGGIAASIAASIVRAALARRACSENLPGLEASGGCGTWRVEVIA
jgi:hypothetical protein